MRPIVLTKALVAAVVNNIALTQSLAGAGNLVLNGSTVSGGVATLDTQRRISILSSGNDSGLTWTLYGANDAGAAITEAVAGGNAVAVVTQQDFKTITRIAGSGATAGTIQVGTNATGSTPWQVPNAHITPFELEIATVLLSGTATWTIEYTLDDVKMPIPIYQTGYSQAIPIPNAIGWPGLVGLIGNAQGEINSPIAGWRATITAGTGTVKTTGIQSGIRN